MNDSKASIAPSRTEWSTPQKIRVKALHDEAGWSKKAIATELSIPRSTVYRLASTNDRRDGKTRIGCPTKLSSSDIDALVTIVTKNGWKGRTYTWDGLVKESGLQVYYRLS